MRGGAGPAPGPLPLLYRLNRRMTQGRSNGLARRPWNSFPGRCVAARGQYSVPPLDNRQTGGNPEKPSEWNIVFSFRTAFLPIAAVMLLVPLAGAACASAEDPAEPEPTAQLLVGTPPPVVATPVDDAAFEG